MLSTEIQDAATRSVLCWLATVSADGQPNVSPKEVFAVFDTNHLIIANIASPTSVRNIEVNPLVCVSFVEIFRQKGFKVIGAARSLRKTESGFPIWSAPLLSKAGSRFPIHSVIVVKVSAVEPILAPSYRLYAAETTEESQVVSAKRTYGVQSVRGDV